MRESALELLAIGLRATDDTKTGALDIGVKESSVLTDLLTLKVYQFPFITLLWIGVMIMVIGFVMSILYRNKLNRLSVK